MRVFVAGRVVGSVPGSLPQLIGRGHNDAFFLIVFVRELCTRLRNRPELEGTSGDSQDT
jgi:hypothetical protein